MVSCLVESTDSSLQSWNSQHFSHKHFRVRGQGHLVWAKLGPVHCFSLAAQRETTQLQWVNQLVPIADEGYLFLLSFQPHPQSSWAHVPPCAQCSNVNIPPSQNLNSLFDLSVLAVLWLVEESRGIKIVIDFPQASLLYKHSHSVPVMVYLYQPQVTMLKLLHTEWWYWKMRPLGSN